MTFPDLLAFIFTPRELRVLLAGTVSGVLLIGFIWALRDRRTLTIKKDGGE